MKRFHILFAVCIAAIRAFAVVATPELVWRQLPDGTWCEVYIRGDEHYHYLTTLDGEKIAGTTVGTLSMPSEHLRAPQYTKLTSFVPSSGTVRIPVILLNFADVAFSIDDPLLSLTTYSTRKAVAIPMPPARCTNIIMHLLMGLSI